MALETKKKQPVSIVILSALYIVLGVLGTIAHYIQFWMQRSTMNANEALWITVLGVAAALAGVFMLQGRNWARWLALAWMAAHVVISVFHTKQELIIHSVLFLVIGYLLLRRPAQVYFNPA